MIHRLRCRLTLTICLALLLSGTVTPSQAGHKHKLIIKARGQSAHQGTPDSAAEPDSQSASGDETEKSKTLKLKNKYLQIEVLTGGNWVRLDTTKYHIETPNLPLRISYQHFQKSVKTIPLIVTLEKLEDQFVFNKDKSSGLEHLKNSEKQLGPTGILSNDEHSAIYPRLQPGSYFLKVTPDNGPTVKSLAEVRLNISAAPLEPPIINAIDQRLAERGKLSIKLKNIVVKDDISLFVNGEPAKPRQIKKESELDSYLSYGAILPPGPSTITVKVQRKGKESEYSQAVSALSRSTVIMARNTNLIQNDFDNREKNRLDDPRLKDTTEFEFVNSRKSRKNRKYVTKKELQEHTNLILSRINQMQTNQTFKQYEDEITSLKKEVKTLKKQLNTQKSRNSKLDQEILRKIDERLKCYAYLHSSWHQEPVLSWPEPDRVRESHLKKLDQLVTHSLGNSGSKIDSKYITPVRDACNQSGEFTLDITFKALDSHQTQNQLKRIITFSQDENLRNFTLGQYKDELVFRLRTDTATGPNLNGLGQTHGSLGIHFFKGLTADKNYNVVVSFYDQTLHFWVNGKKQKLEVDYGKSISGWAGSPFEILLGNELSPPDETRKWPGEVHSFSIRNRGVKLPKPDFDVFECVLSGKSASNLLVSKNDSESTRSSVKIDTETEQIKLPESALKKTAVREFAFPYPASFPVPRYHWDGHTIETEGAVLDQMRLAISKDGRYQLDFETRTTMRAEITLQLLVQLDNGQWYPLTIPKQTIVPSNYSHDLSQPADFAGTKTIKGYAPVLANRSEQILDIRRRGNATFGTAPYIN